MTAGKDGAEWVPLVRFELTLYGFVSGGGQMGQRGGHS